ncbi:hypothetical protein HUT18_09270 [Streptomyces sp. NA04227]|uniref:hypothetical protein n=1 Tax=Streptomyces sp. NA04227 TaxID=2742136 RepID=UPI001592A4AB|nr:hypothetical protein [Streptomyces sp. NA04227]QKW06564.1 hypothetical protein HUT18_09270 [Streptomyces sp. NA04227]
MELTYAAIADLLDQLGPGNDHMPGNEHIPGNDHLYLSADLDPQGLMHLLGHMYGAPRTLVLDGFSDPTVDESRGAALLVPFADRAVFLRAWAYGDRWIGGGIARDDEGVERPVLAVAACRVVPEAPAGVPWEAEDGDEGDYAHWAERLLRITDWAGPARRPDVDWAQVEARLGSALPSDYRRMVETFGEGAFDGFLSLNQEPWTHFRDDSLLVWASTEHENLYCWRADGDDPDRWPVVVRSSDGEDFTFACGAAEFVCRILTEPDHPWTMAHYFDTHWFMSYVRDGESE